MAFDMEKIAVESGTVVSASLFGALAGAGVLPFSVTDYEATITESGRGVDLLWFGVLMLVVMEISFTTPPFGLLIYVMKGVAPDSISLLQVYRAAMPFIVLELLVLALIIAFPQIATWLPQLMRN